MADSDEPVNLFAQQDANRRRSRWLIIGFIAFFAWLGFGGDWILYLATASAPPRAYHHVFPWFGLLLLAMAGGLAAWTWRTGAEKVLWSAGAREVVAPATAEEQQFVNVVEEMAIASGVPKPRCWIVPDDDPNAFATGHDQHRSHIAVTHGLLQLCTRDELQGVVAHEMGHVKNLDVQLMTLLAGLVGAIALISDGMARLLRGGVRFGGSRAGGGGGGGGGKKGAGNPFILIIIAIWFLSWLLAPVISRLLALGISRKREYLADAMSAQFTRNPTALASALEKIEGAHAATSAIKHGSAHLCIADPLGRRVSAREGWLADRLATHPPMPIRVARLRAMGYQAQKRATGMTSAMPGA